MINQAKRTHIFPLIMIMGGLILILASVLWIVRSTQAQNDPTSVPALSNTAMRIPHPEIKRISLADAKTAFDQDQAVFVDTRGDPYFSQGHIPGALSISEDELINHLGELDESRWIITYCT